MTDVVKTHASTVVSKYSGKIAKWDVVNEIFADDGSGLRPTVFSNVLGEDFVSLAFNAAHEADPNAKLYINDYGLESGPKRQVLIENVKKWIAAGVPIHGVGTQTHLLPGQTDGYQASLEELASLGIEVAITELDIDGAPPSDYAAVTKACLAVDACVGITTWGVSDAVRSLCFTLDL